MNSCKQGMHNKKIKGFTLIELLVVIAIITVLLGILMPTMRKIKGVAREVVCESNLRQVGVAVAMYLDDNERKIPNTLESNGFLWDNGDGIPRKAGSGGGTYWGTFYREYIKETKTFGCPSLQRVPEGLIYSYSDFPDPAEVI